MRVLFPMRRAGAGGRAEGEPLSRERRGGGAYTGAGLRLVAPARGAVAGLLRLHSVLVAPAGGACFPARDV